MHTRWNADTLVILHKDRMAENTTMQREFPRLSKTLPQQKETTSESQNPKNEKTISRPLRARSMRHNLQPAPPQKQEADDGNILPGSNWRFARRAARRWMCQGEPGLFRSILFQELTAFRAPGLFHHFWQPDNHHIKKTSQHKAKGKSAGV